MTFDGRHCGLAASQSVFESANLTVVTDADEEDEEVEACENDDVTEDLDAVDKVKAHTVGLSEIAAEPGGPGVPAGQRSQVKQG